MEATNPRYLFLLFLWKNHDLIRIPCDTCPLCSLFLHLGVHEVLLNTRTLTRFYAALHSRFVPNLVFRYRGA